MEPLHDFHGPNAGYVLDLYDRYRKNPESVDPATRAFFEQLLGWKFTDYGPDYTAFEGAYVDGGFTSGKPVKGSVLVILYSNDLEATLQKVVAAGGTIVKDIFSFPGGRRFHFTDMDGYELAVWSLT